MIKPGHNSGDMSEADRKVLFFINRQAYLKAMEAKKLADAAVKNVGKQIKSDLGPNGLIQIKEYERARTPEGEAAIKAEMEAKRQSWRWAGMPVDTQADMFTDLAPLDERAFEEGETAGLEGETYANPYDENSHHGKQFEAGWKAGQAKLFEGIKKKEVDAKAEANELIKGESPFADDEAA
jgi:hypothetical protein